MPATAVRPPAPAIPTVSTALTRPEGSETTSDAPPTEVVLDVEDLRTHFFTYDGTVKALDGVTFDLRRGETTGLVGETGCGKSVTAFSITRLIADPPGRVMGGRVVFRGANLLWRLEEEARFTPIRGTGRVRVHRSFRRIKAANDRMSAVRGRGIAMIFQEPTQAMNPVFSIANQLGEVLLVHRGREILDEMLAATPDGPGVQPAIQAILEATRQGRRDQLRVAARALAAATRSPSLEVEATAIARSGHAAAALRVDLERAVGRRRLHSLRRSYLAHERRLTALRDALNEVYLSEMREGKPHPAARDRLRLRVLSERLSHAYFRLWGMRAWVRRPLDEELFWRSVRLLEGVSIANPIQVARGYPHELSGGMLQRVMIAMALSSDPDVLIADEPTTALDVTIQAQILDLVLGLRRRAGTAVLLITHDLAVVAEVADRVCVMYAGQIVERARVADLFREPLHPYSQGLLASIPRVDQPEKELSSIPGTVPNLIDPPSGCRFHPRCPHAMPICRESRPPMTVEGSEHTVACYLYHGPRVKG